MSTGSDELAHILQRNIVFVMPTRSNINFDFDFQDGSKRLHIVISDNQAEQLIFARLTYDQHHSDPSFIDEYNTFVNGMIFAWRSAVIKLLHVLDDYYSQQTIDECRIQTISSHPQLHFASYKANTLMNIVTENRRQPIGKLSLDYMRKIMTDIDNDHDALFVYKLATCTKFEIYSEQFQFPDKSGELTSKLKLVTVCYFKKYHSDDDSTLTPEQYDFGFI